MTCFLLYKNKILNLSLQLGLFAFMHNTRISVSPVAPGRDEKQVSLSLSVCLWILLVSFWKWCLGGKLTWLDMDPCYSWFGYRQVGLRGHRSAPPRSQLSFPHSEQSASEHLEYQWEERKAFLTKHTHKHIYGSQLHLSIHNKNSLW